MSDRQIYKVILLLGSNLPLGNLSPEQILEEADKEIVDALLPDYLEVESLDDAVCATEIIQTEPCGVFDEEVGEDGKKKKTPVFFNQVLSCLTFLKPEQVLLQTQRIEKLFGRMRDYKQKEKVYQSRTLDIDILKIFKKSAADKLADKRADKNIQWVEIKLNTPELTLPHPQVEDRAFVRPLMEKLNH